jgi:hypothetical protein
MTDAGVLCKFLANPFGDEQRARKLLSEIDNRPPSDTELERGVFCFQIASYFLACLAITAHVEDASLQKKSINQLNDRIRAFYARSALQVRFSEFIVSPAERDRFIAVLRQQLDQPGETRVDATAPATTMLALFDFVVAHRLGEYVDAIGHSDHARRLCRVAEQVLFHYGAKEYRQAAVAAIADLLADHYNTASAIVVSGLRPVDAPLTEDDDVPAPIPVSPKMPDVTDRQPTKIYLAGRYVLRLVEDVGPVGGGDIIRYRYVLAVYDRRGSLPLCLVTLEDSSSISNVLGVFERDGSHSNYGTLRGRSLQAFIGECLGLIRYRFDLGEIEEVDPWSQPPRRRYWQNSETVAQTAA